MTGTLVDPALYPNPANNAKFLETSGGALTWAAPTGSRVLDWLNVKDYGAVGDGVTDDTAAFTAAFAAAVALLGTVDHRPTVYVPAGRYMVHELAWTSNVLLLGNDNFHCQLRYNGAGGPGSYVIKLSAIPPAAYGGYGLQDIGVYGHSLANTTDKIAERCIWITGDGTTGPDWGLQMRNVHAGFNFGDTLLIGTVGDTTHDTMTNFHLEHCRFDCQGGWAIAFYGQPGDGNPMTVDKMTWGNDWGTPNNIATIKVRALADGYVTTPGGHWGNGFMYIDQAKDAYIHVSDSRLEATDLQIFDSRRQLFYARTDNTHLRLSGVVGSFQQTTPGIVFRDKAGQADLFTDGGTYLGFGKLYETGRATSPEWDIPGTSSKRAPLVAAWGGSGASNGIYLNGSQLEFRDSIPSGVSRDYKRGDIVFNRAATTGQPVGWIATTPTNGWGNPTNPTLSTQCKVTVGSKIVTVTIPSEFSAFPVGTAITILGAGSGGADLNTYITDIDYAAYTFTVNDTILTAP
jgi:hypothetical protein